MTNPHRASTNYQPTEVIDPGSTTATGRSIVAARAHPAPEDGSQATATGARRLWKSQTIRGQRPSTPFGASVLLTVVAQGLLAALIAAKTIPPLIGALAAIGLLCCGLLLILAETITAARR